MVKGIAKKYLRSGVELDDLIQEGMLGLLTAIKRWDETRGASLRTLAFFLIKAHIRKALGFENVSATRQGPRPENSRRSNYSPFGVSLDDQCGSDTDMTLHDVLASEGATPEELYSQARDEGRLEAREAIEKAIGVLTPAELEVICARYDGKGKTLREVGADRGVSRERARQIEATGLARMRKALARA